jgi:hypothetical protein
MAMVSTEEQRLATASQEGIVRLLEHLYVEAVAGGFADLARARLRQITLAQSGASAQELAKLWRDEMACLPADRAREECAYGNEP